MDDSEKRKVKEMLRNREQVVPSMDWMYKGDKPCEEDYLLGKRVDRHVEKEQEPSQEDDIFGERIKANIALDMAAKAREDPLFAIRKREEEARRRLLENPIKMKMLKKSLERRQKKEKKQKKKHSDSDEDDIMQKYLSILDKKQKGKHFVKPKKSSGSHNKHQTESDDSDRRQGNSHRNKHRGDSDKRSDSYRHRRQSHGSGSDSGHKNSSRKGIHRYRDKHGYASDENNLGKISKYKSRHGERLESKVESPKYRKDHRTEIRQTERDESSDDDSEDSSDDNREQKPRTYGLITKKTKTQPDTHGKAASPRRQSRSPGSKRSRSPNTRKLSKSQPSGSRRQSPPRKMTSEEKQGKLEEMMCNAKWREGQRKQNVSRYREEEAIDARRHTQGEHNRDFLNSMMSSHAEKSSVEDRIKRNKYNIQRTRADMDKDFLKK